MPSSADESLHLSVNADPRLVAEGEAGRNRGFLLAGAMPKRRTVFCPTRAESRLLAEGGLVDFLWPELLLLREMSERDV